MEHGSEITGQKFISDHLLFFDVRQKNYYLKSPLWRQTGFKKIEIKQEIISLTRLLLKDVTKHIALNKKRESIPED